MIIQLNLLRNQVLGVLIGNLSRLSTTSPPIKFNINVKINLASGQRTITYGGWHRLVISSVCVLILACQPGRNNNIKQQMINDSLKAVRFSRTAIRQPGRGNDAIIAQSWHQHGTFQNIFRIKLKQELFRTAQIARCYQL